MCNESLNIFRNIVDEYIIFCFQEDHDRAMDCLIEVATRGDKDCMMKTAKAYDTGLNLGTARYILLR